MRDTTILLLALLLALLSSSSTWPPPSTVCAAAGQHCDGDMAAAAGSLPSCLLAAGVRNFSLAGSPAYDALLNFSIQNLRFALPAAGAVPRPAAVVLPRGRSELTSAVLCARHASLRIRVRSGGHSYEGLSYTVGGDDARTHFVVIDLMRMNRVRVDAASATAWVESGATLGEIYYAVASSSSSLAFPAGSCSTVGAGGHISGGGFGLLSRKFKLAADNVLDAILVDADGRVLDRSSMGEDVFWAIRGDGGGSWGVVYAWKLRLVQVPNTVTAFTPTRTGSVDAIAGLVHRWQFVGPALPDEFYLSVFLTIGGASSSSPSRDGNVTVSFTGLVLGPKELAMSVLSERFPELGLAEAEMSEMSWVESAARYARLSTTEELTSRASRTKHYAKSKSDYVRSPIARAAVAAILRYLAGGPAGYVILDPYGGAMARAGSADTPFPHRAGNLYSVQYGVTWEGGGGGGGGGEARMAWLRTLYAYMAPHVSKNPRAAYVNYVDLDLGTNALAGNASSSSSSSPVSRARQHGRRGARRTSRRRTSTGSSGPRRSSIVPMSSAMRRAFHRYKYRVES
uniref:FAD-binding PCMH-type domain-containing protein n=1 Tax=Oryza meridionalis TaxID=40149 RepID=A0A0E0EKK8_9ORYZ